MKNLIIISMLLVVICFHFSCNESLPSRIVPNKVVTLNNVFANYENAASSPFIHFAISGENIYEETLQDTLAIDGRLNIWSYKRPGFKATVPIWFLNGNHGERINNRTLFTLDPGERFFVLINWYGEATDERNIFDLLDYPDDLIVNNLSYSVPETLNYNIHLKIFDQPNMEMYFESDFVFESWKIVGQSLL